MTFDPADLGIAILCDDATSVRDLLAPATEADRRAAAKALAGLLKGPGWPKTMDDLSPEQRANFVSWRETSERPAFVAAAVGMAGGIGVAFKALDDYLGSRDTEVYDAVTAVLADRNPPWLSDLIDRRLTQASRGLPAWPLARRLVRLGAISRPGVAEYTAQLPHWVCRGAGREQPVVDALRALRADPGLLEDEVWRIFTVPGTERGLRFYTFFPNSPDSWEPESVWSHALATLSDDGTLDRGRLLDACLEAFVRDFPANQLRWYLEFHDKLAPRPDEVAARADKYLALLAAPAPVAVALGQRACGALLDGGPGRLDVSAFLAAAPPAFGFPQKWVALDQLKLLGKLAARDASARPQALAVAAEAFTHPPRGRSAGSAQADRKARYPGRSGGPRGDYRPGRVPVRGPRTGRGRAGARGAARHRYRHGAQSCLSGFLSVAVQAGAGRSSHRPRRTYPAVHPAHRGRLGCRRG